MNAMLHYLEVHLWTILIYGYFLPVVLSKIWMVLGIVDQLKQDIKWALDRHNYPITKWGDVIIMIVMPWVPFLNIFITYVACASTIEAFWNKTVIKNKVEVNFDDITQGNKKS